MSENKEAIKEENEKKVIKGTIEGVNGPVVDVLFARGELPKIRDELYVNMADGRKLE